MTDNTTRLQLPYILPSQAQKHVTHNEALQRLDATIQLVVTAEKDQPPESVQEGQCYLIATSAAGDWAGKARQLAFRQDEAWLFIMPANGWRAWVAETSRLKVLIEGTWKDVPLPDTASFTTLGIGTSGDAYNRLAVASSATLLTNAPSGGGHQLKINKAAASDTASLLFQSNWGGRAEMGLAGTDAFSIKTSADGSNWQVALSASGSGVVSMPNRPVARAGRAAGTFTPATGTFSGFTDLNAQQGGFALGAVVSGSTKDLRVPVTGLYQISLALSVVSSSGHSVEICVNGTKSGLALSGTSTAANSTQFASFIMSLNENDRLSLSHTGTCVLTTGAGKTELSAIML